MTNPTTQPRWGNKNRKQKAHAILQTIRHYTPPGYFTKAVCLDIGCGNGEIAFHLAPHVYTVTGIDPEPWHDWHQWQQQRPNLNYLIESAMRLSYANNTVDLIVCNQVYEHVPDPVLLIYEINRVLKPGGYCYFAGPNLLFPIEPHVFWPFVHWLPRRLAVRMMQLAGSKGILDAHSTHYWRLRRWMGSFVIHNAIPDIIKQPEQYGYSHWLWRGLSYIPSSLLNSLTWLSPGFVFVLQKPQFNNTNNTL
jgi:2-polyprenyl-3-methyl-5-hydroxy-6-metoxy-1,4-benzoquinol methylase